MMSCPDANAAYAWWLETLLTSGERATSRGLDHREVPLLAVELPLDRALVSLLERRLSRRFAAAEPLWLLSGSDRVAEIAPYNAAMARYADPDGRLCGAYGPRLVAALPGAVELLRADRGTRQAVISLWRPELYAERVERGASPADVPCTLALVPSIRGSALHVYAVLRSSDAWLGVPYDWFSFATIAAYLIYALEPTYPDLRLGSLRFAALSGAHLRDGRSARAGGRRRLPRRAAPGSRCSDELAGARARAPRLARW